MANGDKSQGCSTAAGAGPGLWDTMSSDAAMQEQRNILNIPSTQCSPCAQSRWLHPLLSANSWQVCWSVTEEEEEVVTVLLGTHSLAEKIISR